MAAAILLAASLGQASFGQTIRPVIVEYKGKAAKGSVEIVNPGLLPLTVIVEPKSFSVSETGDINYRPLDANIHLKLSAMSFRIPPQQSYFLFYEVQPESMPCWFVIYASIGGFRKSPSGMNIRLDLPHTVYVLPKTTVQKDDLVLTPLGLTGDKQHLRFRVTNHGVAFGRVLSTRMVSRKAVAEGSGFPLFPHSSRVFEVPCKAGGDARTLRLRTKQFELAEAIPETPDEDRNCAI